MEDSKNKEDAQKGFRYGSTKNQTTSKIEINQKHLVIDIEKSKYGTTKLEEIFIPLDFSPLDFGRDQLKSWHSTE